MPFQAKASFRKALQGLFQKPLSHAEQELRKPSRPLTLPVPRLPPTLNGPSEEAEIGGAAGKGLGARPPRPPLCLSGFGRPRRAPPRKAAATDSREAQTSNPRRPHAGHCFPDHECVSEPGA